MASRAALALAALATASGFALQPRMMRRPATAGVARLATPPPAASATAAAAAGAASGTPTTPSSSERFEESARKWWRVHHIDHIDSWLPNDDAKLLNPLVHDEHIHNSYFVNNGQVIWGVT